MTMCGAAMQWRQIWHYDNSRFSLMTMTFQPSRPFWSHRKRYSLVRPGRVSPLREVPDHIPRPGYALDPTTFDYGTMKGEGECKTEEQIEGVRRACRVARSVLDHTAKHITPGTTTEELDIVAHECCIKFGAYPSPLLYRGYPKSICTSVNNVACHGIPDSRPLEDGDIINVDVTVSQMAWVCEQNSHFTGMFPWRKSSEVWQPSRPAGLTLAGLSLWSNWLER